MPNYTTNLSLKKPLATENYNIDDSNGNADLIDVAVASKETPTGSQAKATAAENSAKTYADTKDAAHVGATNPHSQYALDTAFTAHLADEANKLFCDIRGARYIG